MAGEVTWAAEWRCDDCDERVPIDPGQNTRPITEAHECDSFKLATHQSRMAGWREGYLFALENYDDELVQADKRDQSGWLRVVAQGGIVINADEATDG